MKSELTLPYSKPETPRDLMNTVQSNHLLRGGRHYLYDCLSDMRTYPLEDKFQEGYERAFSDVMYHLLSASSAAERTPLAPSHDDGSGTA